MKVKTGIVLGTRPRLPSASHPRSPITGADGKKSESLPDTRLDTAPARAPRKHDGSQVYADHEIQPDKKHHEQNILTPTLSI